MEHTLGFLPQRAKLYQPGARKELTKKKKKKRKKTSMEPGRADCISKPGRADVSREIKADRSTAGEMPTAPSPSPRPGSHAAGKRRRKKNAFFFFSSSRVLPAGR